MLPATLHCQRWSDRAAVHATASTWKPSSWPFQSASGARRQWSRRLPRDKQLRCITPWGRGHYNTLISKFNFRVDYIRDESDRVKYSHGCGSRMSAHCGVCIQAAMRELASALRLLAVRPARTGSVDAATDQCVACYNCAIHTGR